MSGLAANSRHNANSGSAVTNITSAFSTLGESTMSVLHSHFASTWAAFHPEEVSFESWTDSLTSLMALLFMFDFVYRVLHTIKIIRKYWSLSAGDLPPIDLRMASEKENILSKSVYKVFCILDAAGIQIGLLLLFALLVVFIIASLYWMAFMQYNHACVSGLTNSTLLMRTLHTSTYNYASFDANSLSTKLLNKYNSESYELCSRHYYSSRSEYTSNLDILHNINDSYTKTERDVALLSSCVSLQSSMQMDASHFSHCCHYQAYQHYYRSVSHSFSFSLLLLSYYDIDDDEYTNLCLSTCCSFYSYTSHFSSSFSFLHYTLIVISHYTLSSSSQS